MTSTISTTCWPTDRPPTATMPTPHAPCSTSSRRCARVTTGAFSTDIQRESLDMIQMKIRGEYFSGDPGHADHWDDITGYARLAAHTVTRQAQAPSPHPSSHPTLRGRAGAAGGTHQSRVRWSKQCTFAVSFPIPRR